MKKRRTLAPVAMLTGVVGAVVAAAVVGAGDATVGARSTAQALLGDPLGSAPVGDGRAAILNRAPSADDLPSQRTLDLGRRSMLSAFKDVRLARSIGPVRVLVAPASRGTDICLIVEDSSEDSTAIDCTRRSVLAKGAIYLTKPDSATGTVDVFALVGNGVTQVGPAPVQNNVAIIEDFAGQLVTLTDNAGRSSTMDLGPQF